MRHFLLATSLLLPLPALAQADHPADQPIVVGSDFGVAPWMVRGLTAPRASA